MVAVLLKIAQVIVVEPLSMTEQASVVEPLNLIFVVSVMEMKQIQLNVCKRVIVLILLM